MLKYKEISINDIDNLINMYIETFNSEPWNDNWTIKTAKKRLHQMINSEDFFGVSAYKDDELCGMILGNKEQFYDGLMFNIKEFCIKNDMRGQGVGSKIFNDFLIMLKNKGIDKVILLTTRGHFTEHFYNKFGLKTYEDLIFMGKQL